MMGSAKDIILRPIDRKDADTVIKRVHYSGKVVQNSSIHIGVFYQGRLEGAMQFGPSLDKRKIQPLVSGTLWNEFIELNRMAFSDNLPRNSESRALGIAMRMLRQHAPQLKWVISFADATQCGDGTIYRASGFVLTGVKENSQTWIMPKGDDIRALIAYNQADTRWQAWADYADRFRSVHTMFVQGGTRNSNQQKLMRDLYREVLDGRQSMSEFMALLGGEPFPGFQLRYIYFLDPTARERLTVPILPFSEIERRGAGMYKGQSRAGSKVSVAPVHQTGEGGAEPTSALQTE